MIRKVVAALGGVLLLCMLFINSGIASAATAPTLSSASDFSKLEKTCTVIYATLHGTQSPTMSCAQTKTQALSAVSPNTEVRPCNVPGVTMEILYNNTQKICFIQKGYWGYRVNNVSQVTSPTDTDGWFLWYYRGSTSGSYCNLNGYNLWQATLLFGITVDITQIDPGAQQSSSSC